ncbi:hypothetical protein ACH5RR_032454 [Cinchona calisaya]|uniref:Uncharacterized protein n=1 Tax=Cinchona calisaya TaxID=153742 RepID=A0ABD2YI44_9GENT
MDNYTMPNEKALVEQTSYCSEKAIEIPDVENSPIPVVLVENSERRNKNENDEKILPNGTAWIPNLIKAITDVVSSGGKGILDDKKLIEGSNPNYKGKLLIPLIAAFQYFFVIKRIQKWIREYLSQEYGPSWA